MNRKGKRLAGRWGLNRKHKAIGSIILASPCQMGTWKGRGRVHKHIKGRRKTQRKSSTPELVSKVTWFMQREFSENKKSTVDKERQQNAYSLVHWCIHPLTQPRIHSSTHSQTFSSSVLHAPQNTEFCFWQVGLAYFIHESGNFFFSFILRGRGGGVSGKYLSKVYHEPTLG